MSLDSQPHIHHDLLHQQAEQRCTDSNCCWDVGGLAYSEGLSNIWQTTKRLGRYAIQFLCAPLVLLNLIMIMHSQHASDWSFGIMKPLWNILFQFPFYHTFACMYKPILSHEGWKWFEKRYWLFHILFWCILHGVSYWIHWIPSIAVIFAFQAFLHPVLGQWLLYTYQLSLNDTQIDMISVELLEQGQTIPNTRRIVTPNLRWNVYGTWYWYFPVTVFIVLIGMVWTTLPYWVILTVFGSICVGPMNILYYIGSFGNTLFYMKHCLMYIYILWSSAWPWFCVYTMIWATDKEITNRMFYIYLLSQLLFDMTADTLLSLAFGQAIFSRFLFVSQVTKQVIQYFVFGITPWSWMYVVTVIGFNLHNLLQLCGVYNTLLAWVWKWFTCCCCCCGGGQNDRNDSSSNTPQSIRTQYGHVIETMPEKCLSLIRWKSRVLLYLQDLLSEGIGLLSLLILVTYPSNTFFISDSLFDRLPERLSFLLFAKFCTWIIAKPILKRLYPYIATHYNCNIQINHDTLISTIRQLDPSISLQERKWIQDVVEQEHDELFLHIQGTEWSWDTWLSSNILSRHAWYYIGISLFVLLTLTLPWWDTIEHRAII